jgi:acylphosphatase
MLKRCHLIISGRVQGVAYRYSLEDLARRLGINGWVKNTSRGQVEALLEGKEDKIKEAVAWCHKGPSLALVEDIEIEYEEYQGEFDTFSIKF